MTPEFYEQIGQLYDAALELTPEERSAFLDSACGSVEELRQEVESLLEAHEQAGDFIAAPALEMAAELLEDEEAPSLANGQSISHYQVLSLLGAGGMGEVYLARDTKLGREVAFKLLPKEFTRDPDRVRRFEQEARAVSALNHPNILTIHEIGRAGGNDFIAAEFIDGVTLRAHMTRTRMRLVEAIDVAAQLSSALEVVHAAGVVHRDIKPENIMVRRDHIVKLLDFGLTKLTETVPATQRRRVGSQGGSTIQVDTEPGLVLGTAQYMSPEQSRGCAQVDHRTDIWSLGVVLYEMVAGRVPFEGKDIHRRIISIQESEPPPLAGYAEQIPERLEEIVRKALAKDPDERYQTARDFLIDLRDLKWKLEVGEQMLRSSADTWTGMTGRVSSNGSPAAVLTQQGSASRPLTLDPAPPISSARVMVGELKRHQRGFTVVLAVLIVLTAGAFFGLYRWLNQARPSNKVSGPAPKIIPFTSSPGVETEPSFSPDGRQIAFSWSGESGDNFDIYVKMLDTGVPLRLTSNPSEERFPSWSPDGRHVAFIRYSESENAVALVPALGGPERILHSTTSTGFRSLGHFLSWSPDGKSLALSERDSQQEPYSIYLLSVETLERRKLTSPPAATNGDSSPAISPDGNTLAFTRLNNTATNEIYLAPVAGGEPKRVTSDNWWITGFAWTPDGREIVFSSNRAGTRSLWRIAISGGTPKRVAAGEENPSSPAIARYGQRLAYTYTLSDTNIWRIEVPRASAVSSAPTKLIASTRADTSPQYSADGKKIVFSSIRTGTHEIWTSDADGSNLLQLTSFGGPHVGTPRWSPDGRQISFDCPTDGHRDIYVVGAGGGKPRRLTAEASTDVRPSWSRDGRFIYFGSNRSGEWQVWRAPAEGGPAIQVTKQGGREAFESVDGKFVYYCKENDIYGLWRVPAEGGEEVKILDHVRQGAWAVLEQGLYFVNPQVRPRQTIEFFSFATGRTNRVATVQKELPGSGPSLTVSPDGRWILFVQLDQVESDIMLVENFS